MKYLFQNYVSLLPPQMWAVVRGDLTRVQAAALDAYWQLLSASLADPQVRQHPIPAASDSLSPTWESP